MTHSADEMPRARHLVQKAGWYHSRLVVPGPLIPFIGKKELWTALGTASRSDANHKLPAALARQRARLEAARVAAKAAHVQLETMRRKRLLTPRQIAQAHYSHGLTLDTEARNAGRYDSANRDWSRIGYATSLQRVASGSASDDECRVIIGWAIDVFAANGNVKADQGTPEWRALVRQLAAIQLEIEKRKDERDRGEGDTAPTHPLLAESPVDAALESAAGEGGKTLTEIVPEYVRERRATDQTNSECKNTVRMFYECLGEAKPLYAITKADVRAFKRMLSELPVHYRKHFPSLTVPEAIKANQARPVPFKVLDARTINDKYLSKLHALLGWCKRQDIISANPADDVKIENVGSKDSRKKGRDFSPGDLAKIFSPERFDESKPFDEKQWALLLALFTGARASELAQLQLDSIRQRNGCLVMAIEEETKNDASQRVVPIHSTLIALGFQKRVDELRAKGVTHFFPDWYHSGAQSKERAKASGKNTLNHHFPKFIPRWFNVTVKRQLKITERRKVFHSFRHTFTTALDEAGVSLDMQERLCGHTKSTPHAGYVHGTPIEAMKAAIEKLRFDGFTLA
jgi:integrase